MRLGPGTLYGAIGRLEERGLIEAVADHGRARPYRLTDAGGAVLVAALAELRTIVDVGTRRPGEMGGRIARSDHVNRWAIAALLLLFPRAWRARYGEELTQLVAETSRAGSHRGGSAVIWCARPPPNAHGASGSSVIALSRTDRATGGCLAVLWAWVAFVVAGTVVQKASEHWQGAVPAGDRALPTVAFSVLVAGAAWRA